MAEEAERGELMRDPEARELALRAQQSVQALRDDQAKFQASILEQIAAALTPVATQASKALTEAARAGAQAAHIQEQLEVLAVEGNDNRVSINALRESLTQQVDNLTGLLTGIKSLGDSITVVEAPANRETRRHIERSSRRTGS